MVFVTFCKLFIFNILFAKGDKSDTFCYVFSVTCLTVYCHSECNEESRLFFL